MHVSGSTCSADELPSSSPAAPGASAVFDAIVGTATPDPSEVVGALLTERLPEIPGARWASITQRRSESIFVTVAASADIARQADDAQYEVGDGPCLRAVGGTVVAADAATLHQRWPAVASRMAASTPVRAVLSQPLRPDVALGSLNVYTDRPGGFTAPAIMAAADVAAACALAVVAVRERVRADNLLVALDSSRRIGAAIGIVMAIHRYTYEQAFETLRVASQKTHRKLRDVAEEIVITGAIPDG